MTATESRTPRGTGSPPRATEGSLEHDGLRTWFRVVGDVDSARPAVVVVHGGPGATHDYLESLEVLADDGRAVVFYDQVGGGRSSHHADVPAGFWTAGLFVDELHALISHLGIDRYHLLGQSWGAMLGLELALRRAPGLCSLVLANGLASVPRYVEANDRLLGELPKGVADALRRHARAGTTDDPEFGEAIEIYSRRHRLRLDEMPASLQRTNELMGADMSVYLATIGNEFHVTGTLRNWDVTDRLGEIDVPALLISGRYDEVAPVVVEAMHLAIAGSQWELFEEASHFCHLEEPARFRQTVIDFIHRIEEDLMPTTADPAGTDFIRALAERDIEAARGLLDPDVVLTALLPGKTVDKVGVADVLAAFCTFTVDDAVQSLELLDDHEVAGRRSFAYRCQWSTSEHGPHVFEQQGFYDTKGDRISWIHLACSGDQPLA